VAGRVAGLPSRACVCVRGTRTLVTWSQVDAGGTTLRYHTDGRDQVRVCEGE
jgi:hypothetical protein